MLPGDGCVPRMSRPSACASLSTRVITRSSRVGDVRLRGARRQQVFGAHDLGDLAEHRRCRQASCEAIGDAAERRIGSQAGGVVGAAALERQDQRRRCRTTRAARARASPANAARHADALRVARSVPPSPWIDTIADRLAGRRADSASICADDLLAAERHDEDRADIGMLAIRRQRLVRELHVGTELAAAGQVRQRHRAGSAAAAMRSVTTAEQMTVGTTRT